MIALTDCHVHLQDPALADHVEAVLERCAAVGVRRLVVNGTCEADWPHVAKLYWQHPDRIVPCFGLHPWNVAGRSRYWLRDLQAWLDRLPSAVGEIGLDRWIEPRDEAEQERVFRDQLALARELNRPVMVHCLRAWDWLVRVLDDQPTPPAGMLIHAYGGRVEFVEPLARLGAHFSFAGNVFEPKREAARDAVRAVPIDRLLVETDAPDMLPPADHRTHVLIGPDGREHNEPVNLPAIVRGIASLRGETVEAVAKTVDANARRLLSALDLHWSS